MPNYAIMRTEKIKSRVALRRALQHDSRERMPPNADPAKSPDNTVWPPGGVQQALDMYSKKLPAKVRKNAVHAIELMFTSSKSVGDKYPKAAIKWATEMFGTENVLLAAIHKDETTTHAHVIVMPLKDGRLNARAFIGGTRDRMRELQNDFHEKVGKRFDLDRGRPREETKARHSRPTLVKAFEALKKRDEEIAEYWKAERRAVEELKAASLDDVKKEFDKVRNMTTTQFEAYKAQQQQRKRKNGVTYTPER